MHNDAPRGRTIVNRQPGPEARDAERALDDKRRRGVFRAAFNVNTVPTNIFFACSRLESARLKRLRQPASGPIRIRSRRYFQFNRRPKLRVLFEPLRLVKSIASRAQRPAHLREALPDAFQVGFVLANHFLIGCRRLPTKSPVRNHWFDAFTLSGAIRKALQPEFRIKTRSAVPRCAEPAGSIILRLDQFACAFART
jgi:hypothetical protein